MKAKKVVRIDLSMTESEANLLLSAIKLAGYSWLEADKFRKAVGKKIPAEMAAQKKKFTNGIVNNGQSPQFAEKLWKLFEPFQAYGFNKAHAACYGKVAYQTAYMKANYPVEYMASLLTADAGNVDKIAETINECKKMKIPVLPPDINESFGDFTIAKDENGKECIRFGLHSIKNFGEGIADVIIEERLANGRFNSLFDFFKRVQSKNLNRKTLEALIKCGALDAFEERGKLLSNIEKLLTYSREINQSSKAQESLFGGLAANNDPSSIALDSVEPATQSEKLSWEKELLGLYVSGHPLDKFRDIFEKRENTIQKTKEVMKEGMVTVVGGIVEEYKQILTKKGDKMAFFTLTDFTGSIEAVVFPKVYEKFHDKITQESCIAIKGRVSKRNGDTSILVEGIKELAVSA